VRRNDWRGLSVPGIGQYEPSLSVSVVMPAWRPGRALPYVLAALSAQSYPAHLVEVVVVDDGNDSPLDLGPCPPPRTKVVRVEDGWGRAAACALGLETSDGDVVVWLDADMLAHRDHLAAHLRWHHVVDYAVVLGTKLFVDPAPLWEHTPEDVARLVAAGTEGGVFDGVAKEEHDWVVDLWRRSDMLTRAGVRGFRSHVGATGSVRRDLLTVAGGPDPSLVLGEDIELGFRLGEAGGVLVPEVSAEAWHLGRTQVMARRDQVNRHNDAALGHLVPGLRHKRRHGRVYEVPYLEVVVPAEGTAEQVQACVDALLASEVSDVVVRLVGPWEDLTQGRRAVLDDPMVDLRILARTYGPEPRVELVTRAPGHTFPVPWRLELAGTDWAPGRTALLALLEDAERTHQAGRDLLEPASRQPYGILRAGAAVARARRVGARGEDEVRAALQEAYGLRSMVLSEVGWEPTGQVVPPQYSGGVHRPWKPARSRAALDAALGQSDPNRSRV
jgi:glycosyltransferase involved in cell wall biosynthesis